MSDEPTPGDWAETTARKVSALQGPLEDTDDTVIRTAKENAGIGILGALVIGITAGAMLPRRRKGPKKAALALGSSLAATVSELSQALAKQAREHADTTAAEASKQAENARQTIGKSIQDGSDKLGKQSKKLADDAAEQLSDTGRIIAKALVKLIEKVRH